MSTLQSSTTQSLSRSAGSSRPQWWDHVLVIVLYGALWGAVEAFLGYGLHLLRRVVPVPGLTGFMLFPVGLLIMLAAFRASESRWAPLGIAAIAAATKLASVVLPGVTPLFVVNPSLAILAEGAVVTAGVALMAPSRGAGAFPQALTVSFAWRAAFLGLVIALPVQKGILMKGTEALLYFLIVESVVNAVLIGGASLAGITARRLSAASARLATPAVAAAVVVLAVGLQGLSALL